MSKKSIGIDIGSSSIKAVEVSQSRSKIEITRVAEVQLEDRTVINGEVSDLEALTGAIDQLYVIGGFKNSPVTVGIGGLKVYPRQKDFMWEPEDRFREALAFQVADLIDNPEDFALDYHPMGQFDNNGLFIQKNMLVAAPFDGVTGLAEALLASDVKLRKADFVPFALVRAADGITNRKHSIPSYPKSDDDLSVEVVIDIGAMLTTLVIHDRGAILFLRTFPGGGASITRAIQEHLQLSPEVAEELKRNIGISKVTEEVRKNPTLSNISDQDFATATEIGNIIAGHLIQQIRETIEFWRHEIDNSVEIKRILLSGGGSRFGGLPQRIASELRAPVGILKPVKAYGVKGAAKPQLDPKMSVAFGLALDSRGGE